MPVIARDKRGRPTLFGTNCALTDMDDHELADYLKFMEMSQRSLPDSPVITERVEAIKREVRWRAENSQFE